MNTYAEAAAKLGVTIHTLRRMVKRRVIAVVKYSQRTIRITDAEIQRVIEKRTRRAVI
jgi:excisionase family DNA binding protein